MKTSIDLDTHKFDIKNTWVVIGLPNNQAQHEASYERRGIGAQISWANFALPVQFGDHEFTPDHPLYGAEVVKPEKSPDGQLVYRADLYPSYKIRQQQLLVLQKRGLNLILGASTEDFLIAADKAFSCGGLLSLVTHFDKQEGFEFNDGFLAIDDIPLRRRPSGFGLLDVVTCYSAVDLRRTKLSLSPLIWAIGAKGEISATVALIDRLSLWTSIVERQAAPFKEHWRHAASDLNAALNSANTQQNLSR